ncbi:MAG: hypothetical protein WCK78_01975 [Paludibacter sp.]
MKTKILLISLLISGFTYSQVVKYHLPPKSHYKSAVISMYNNEPMKISNVNIKSDSISFDIYTDSDNIYSSSPLLDVDYLQVRQGNNGLNGAIVGSLIMGSILTCKYLNYSLSIGELPELLIFTIGGASIGGVIGLMIPKKKKYFITY